MSFIVPASGAHLALRHDSFWSRFPGENPFFFSRYDVDQGNKIREDTFLSYIDNCSAFFSCSPEVVIYGSDFRIRDLL